MTRVVARSRRPRVSVVTGRVVAPGVTPEPQILGYQRLWPLASWATVDAGDSGVTYTEHADGIEWTIPPGPADVATPELAWRATGPVSAVVPQLAPSPTWWGLLGAVAILEIVPAGGLWYSAWWGPGPLATDGTHGGMVVWPSASFRRVVSARWRPNYGHTAEVPAGVAQGLAVPLAPGRAGGRWGSSVSSLLADGSPAGQGAVATDHLPWDPAAEPQITLAVGRYDEGASGTIRLAPQALLSIAPLAQEGTP